MSVHRACQEIGSSDIDDLETVLRVSAAWKMAGSAAVACGTNACQNASTNTPGIFFAVFNWNHSKYPCSSLEHPNVGTLTCKASCVLVGDADELLCAWRSAYPFPPPPQIPYPSQTLPVERHRSHAGRPSSHFTLRALALLRQPGSLYVLWGRNQPYLQVRQPVFEVVRRRLTSCVVSAIVAL